MYGKNHPKTFLSVYRNSIAPRISELDIFLKTEKEPYTAFDTSQLLNITEDEINTIMSVHNIPEINKNTFPLIMKNCPDEFCRMFKRMLECGIPGKYFPEQISYIYDIDIEKVSDAFNKLNTSVVYSDTLEELFENIIL